MNWQANGVPRDSAGTPFFVEERGIYSYETNDGVPQESGGYGGMISHEPQTFTATLTYDPLNNLHAATFFLDIPKYRF